MSSINIKRFKKIFILLFISLTLSAVICFTVSAVNSTAAKILTLNKTFTVNIPTDFTYSKAEYALSSEITQHYILQGQNDSSALNGYIQVRNLSSSLAEYIIQAEGNFSGSVYGYEKKPALQNGSAGFDINFKIKGITYDTQVMQTLWQRENKLFIISLSTPIEKNNTELLQKSFDELKNSVTLTGDSLPSGKLTEYCIRYI